MRSPLIHEIELAQVEARKLAIAEGRDPRAAAVIAGEMVVINDLEKKGLADKDGLNHIMRGSIDD